VADRKLTIDISVDDQGAVSSLRKVETAIGTTEAKAVVMGEALRDAVFMLAGAVVSAVGMIGAGMNMFANYASKINDLANKTGLTTTELQKLGYAAKMNGVEVETLATGVTRLSRNLAEGKKSAVGALSDLGLNLKQIQAMSPADAFMTIGDAIARIPNPMQQAALAMELFGRGGAELLPMMKGNMSALAAEAERLGIILDEKTIAAGDTLGDAFDRLKVVGMALLAKVLQPMVPLWTEVLQGMANAIPYIDKTGFAWRMFSAEISESISKLYRWMATWGEVKRALAESSANAIKSVFGGSLGGFVLPPSQQLQNQADYWEQQALVTRSEVLWDRTHANAATTSKPRLPGRGFPDDDEAYNNEVKKIAALDHQIQLALTHGLDYDTIMDEFGKKSLDAITDSRVWGISATNDIKAVAASYNDDLVEGALAKLSVETRKTARAWQTEFEKAQKGTADSLNKSLSDAILAQGDWMDKTAALTEKGMGNVWAGIERQRKAALAQWSRPPTGMADAYKVVTDQINVYFDEMVSEANLSQEKLAQQTKEDWRDVLTSLSAAFRNLSQIAGESGLGKTAQFLGNMVGSMEMGATAGDQMATALLDISGGGKKTAEGITEAAAAFIQMAAAMDQATSSTSHWENAISGAATGASMGSVVPGWGTAAGAAAGFIYGYYKGTPQDDVTAAQREQWAASVGGYAELHRLVDLNVITVQDYNTALTAGVDQAEQFKAATDAIGLSMKGVKSTLDTLGKAAQGTKTIADAMGVATTQTQFERLGLYTSAIFGKMLRETGSLAEAFEAVGDTLDSMLKASQDFGLTVSGPLTQLLNLRGILTNNPDLSARITGLGQIGGLGNLLGPMNLQATFGADIADTFSELLRRGGVDENQAMLLLQGPMQALWETTRNGLEQQALTEDTQRLMDRMLSANFIGANMASIQNQQLNVLMQIRDLLAGGTSTRPDWNAPAIAEAAAVAAGYSNAAAMDAATAAGYGYWGWTNPQYGNPYTQEGTVPGYAEGTNGFEYFGSGTPAMLHGWEAVVPLSRTHSGAVQSGQPIVIVVQTNLDGREVARNQVRYIAAELTSAGY
jgi:hypothetical protein